MKRGVHLLLTGLSRWLLARLAEEGKFNNRMQKWCRPCRTWPCYVVAPCFFPSIVPAAWCLYWLWVCEMFHVCLDVSTCSDPRGAWVSRSSYLVWYAEVWCCIIMRVSGRCQIFNPVVTPFNGTGWHDFICKEECGLCVKSSQMFLHVCDKKNVLVTCVYAVLGLSGLKGNICAMCSLAPCWSWCLWMFCGLHNIAAGLDVGLGYFHTRVTAGWLFSRNI